MMKFRFVQYLLIVAVIILVSGCVMDSKVVRLKYASINGDSNTVHGLLAEYGDTIINAKDKKGNTALMYAASNDKSDIAEILLDAGADVSVKNKSGNTALKIAAEINDQKKITSLLVDAGAVR